MPRQPSVPNLMGLSLFRSEEHTSELQSRVDLVCRLLLEKKKLNLSDLLWFGKFRGIVDFFNDAVGAGDPVSHTRSRCDQVKRELALETLLNDLHVQQSQED